MNASTPYYVGRVYGELIRRHLEAEGDAARRARLHEVIVVFRAEWPVETKAWDDATGEPWSA